LEAERTCPKQQIAILRPELVQTHCCHHMLHNKRAAVQKGLLLLKGNQRVVVISVPWYLQSEIVYLALIAVLKLSRTVRVSY
jgi:hypothetical protein